MCIYSSLFFRRFPVDWPLSGQLSGIDINFVCGQENSVLGTDLEDLRLKMTAW